MIILHGFGPALGQPDLSMFVMKVKVLLRMAGLAFEMKEGIGGLRKSPRGKLPFIIDDGETISDSRMIRAHLERKHGVDFSGGYSAEQLAIGHMAEKMLEESSYFMSIQRRWKRDDGWAVLAPAIFSGLPAPLRLIVPPLARRSTIRALHGQGTGRLSDAEIDRLAVQNLDALSTVLGDKPYLLGDRPSGSDATMLAAMIAGSAKAFPGPIREAIVGTPNLRAYRDRVAAQFMPEYRPD